MTIIQKLHKLADTVADEKLAGSATTGDECANDAIKAIHAGSLLPGGQPTAEWKNYMQRFAETQAQLDRLTLQDNMKNQDAVRRSCAYIVANAICGAISTTKTHQNVAAEIEP